MTTRCRTFALVTVLTTMPSCAWSNPDNRPVWNAFETRLVPRDGVWFVATLPATVPLGIASIVTDVFIAHPIQVVDDSFGDASDLWGDSATEFATAYYTEMAWLPMRALATPVTFVGSFVARCLLDIPEYTEPMSAEELARRQREAAAEREREAAAQFVVCLARAAQGQVEAPPRLPEEWRPEFAEPLERAFHADARIRRELHLLLLRRCGVRFGAYDAERGLRDPDPVVRFAVLEAWPTRTRPSAEVTRALLGDASESVRLLARRRFAR